MIPRAFTTALLLLSVLPASASASTDSTPPIVDSVRMEQRTDLGCLSDPSFYPYMPPVTLTIRIEEPESLITAIAWRVLERDWVELDMNELDLSHPGIWNVHSDLIAMPGLPEDAKMEVRVVNATNLATISEPIDVILVRQEDVCEPETPTQPDAGSSGPPKKVEELDLDPTATPDAASADGGASAAAGGASDEGGGGGGCATGGHTRPLPWWLWSLSLVPLFLLSRRERPYLVEPPKKRSTSEGVVSPLRRR